MSIEGFNPYSENPLANCQSNLYISSQVDAQDKVDAARQTRDNKVKEIGCFAIAIFVAALAAAVFVTPLFLIPAVLIGGYSLGLAIENFFTREKEALEVNYITDYETIKDDLQEGDLEYILDKYDLSNSDHLVTHGYISKEELLELRAIITPKNPETVQLGSNSTNDDYQKVSYQALRGRIDSQPDDNIANFEMNRRDQAFSEYVRLHQIGQEDPNLPPPS